MELKILNILHAQIWWEIYDREWTMDGNDDVSRHEGFKYTMYAKKDGYNALKCSPKCTIDLMAVVGIGYILSQFISICLHDLSKN